MVSRFASGVFFAAYVIGLVVSLMAQSASSQPVSSASAKLDIAIQGIRSAEGVIRVAVCSPDTGFPDCRHQAVRSLSLAIVHGGASAQISGLPASRYAVSVFHDANGNGRLDTFLGVPREGFGFSNDPPIRRRAPRFDEAKIDVQGEFHEAIRLRYLM